MKNSKEILARVVVFMKEWIDFSLHEFDERLLMKIQKFANSKLSKVNNKVAEEIVEAINSKVLNFP